MSRTDETLRVLKLYLRHRVDETLDSKKMTATELARRSGLTQGAISQIHLRTRPVGNKAFWGLMRGLGETPASLEEGARTWIMDNPDATAELEPPLPSHYPPEIKEWLRAHPEQNPVAPEVAAVAAAAQSDPSGWTEERIGQQLARVRQAHDLIDISGVKTGAPENDKSAPRPRKRMGPKQLAPERTGVRVKQRTGPTGSAKVK